MIKYDAESVFQCILKEERSHDLNLVLKYSLIPTDENIRTKIPDIHHFRQWVGEIFNRHHVGVYSFVQTIYMFTAQFCYYKHPPSSERQMELVKLSPGQIGRFLLRTLLVLCWRSFTTVTATLTTGHLHSWAWRQRCYHDRRSNMAWEWRAN